MKIIDIYNFLNSIAPFDIALDWDNSGFLIGNKNDQFKGALICLDITDEIIEDCINLKYNLLISHHPIIFDKLKSITSDMLVYKIIKNDINVISLHTNLDIASEGVNFALAKAFGLENITTPLPFGCVGNLKKEVSPKELAILTKKLLYCKKISYITGKQNIKTVAVCGGAGSSFTKDIINLNIDAYITSEIKYNIWLESKRANLTLIDAGHFNTENLICNVLLQKLKNYFKTKNFIIAPSNKDIIEIE